MKGKTDLLLSLQALLSFALVAGGLELGSKGMLAVGAMMFIDYAATHWPRALLGQQSPPAKGRR